MQDLWVEESIDQKARMRKTDTIKIDSRVVAKIDRKQPESNHVWLEQEN